MHAFVDIYFVPNLMQKLALSRSVAETVSLLEQRVPPARTQLTTQL